MFEMFIYLRKEDLGLSGKEAGCLGANKSTIDNMQFIGVDHRSKLFKINKPFIGNGKPVVHCQN